MSESGETPSTVRVLHTCQKCGSEFVRETANGGGRPPKYCPAHRKKHGTYHDVEGHRERKNAMRRLRGRRTKEELDAEALSGEVVDLSKPQSKEMTATLVGNTLHRAVELLSQRLHLLAPRDLAVAAKSLSQIQETLYGGAVAKHNYPSIQVVMAPPADVGSGTDG